MNNLWITYDDNFIEIILLFILLEYDFSWFVLYIKGTIKKGVHFYPQNQPFMKALMLNSFRRLSTYLQGNPSAHIFSLGNDEKFDNTYVKIGYELYTKILKVKNWFEV